MSRTTRFSPHTAPQDEGAAAGKTGRRALMTRDQVQLVRGSFARLAPIRMQAAALFYDRLFQAAPGLRALFPDDLAAQGAKLMAALGFVVAGLDRLGATIPQVQALARRHVAYGVEDEHYEVVGGALIWTLETALGEAFTPDVRRAWTEAYGMLAEAMIAASRGVPEQAAAAA